MQCPHVDLRMEASQCVEHSFKIDMTLQTRTNSTKSLLDCQQTMLVLDAFDEFCKLNEERKSEWKLETLR
jgi:hypothetical protein